MCYHLNCVEPARTFWNDPAVKETMIAENSKSIARLYFDLLFNNGHYNDVLEEFDENNELFERHQDCLVLGRFCSS